MGSDSDLAVMQGAAQALEEMEIAFELTVCPAHRTPDRALERAATARKRGLEVIIAGAGLPAHLPGVLATTLPVIGVPLTSGALNGVDTPYAIVQIPPGIPVATVAIGGARNAGLPAAAIIGSHDRDVAGRLEAFRAQQSQAVNARAQKREEIGYRAYLESQRGGGR